MNAGKLRMRMHLRVRCGTRSALLLTVAAALCVGASGAGGTLILPDADLLPPVAVDAEHEPTQQLETLSPSPVPSSAPPLATVPQPEASGDAAQSSDLFPPPPPAPLQPHPPAAPAHMPAAPGTDPTQQAQLDVRVAEVAHPDMPLLASDEDEAHAHGPPTPSAASTGEPLLPTASPHSDSPGSNTGVSGEGNASSGEAAHASMLSARDAIGVHHAAAAGAHLDLPLTARHADSGEEAHNTSIPTINAVDEPTHAADAGAEAAVVSGTPQERRGSIAMEAAPPHTAAAIPQPAEPQHASNLGADSFFASAMAAVAEEEDASYSYTMEGGVEEAQPAADVEREAAPEAAPVAAHAQREDAAPANASVASVHAAFEVPATGDGTSQAALSNETAAPLSDDAPPPPPPPAATHSPLQRLAAWLQPLRDEAAAAPSPLREEEGGVWSAACGALSSARLIAAAAAHAAVQSLERALPQRVVNALPDVSVPAKLRTLCADVESGWTFVRAPLQERALPAWTHFRAASAHTVATRLHVHDRHVSEAMDGACLFAIVLAVHALLLSPLLRCAAAAAACCCLCRCCRRPSHVRSSRPPNAHTGMPIGQPVNAKLPAPPVESTGAAAGGAQPPPPLGGRPATSAPPTAFMATPPPATAGGSAGGSRRSASVGRRTVIRLRPLNESLPQPPSAAPAPTSGAAFAAATTLPPPPTSSMGMSALPVGGDSALDSSLTLSMMSASAVGGAAETAAPPAHARPTDAPMDAYSHAPAHGAHAAGHPLFAAGQAYGGGGQATGGQVYSAPAADAALLPHSGALQPDTTHTGDAAYAGQGAALYGSEQYALSHAAGAHDAGAYNVAAAAQGEGAHSPSLQAPPAHAAPAYAAPPMPAATQAAPGAQQVLPPPMLPAGGPPRSSPYYATGAPFAYGNSTPSPGAAPPVSMPAAGGPPLAFGGGAGNSSAPPIARPAEAGRPWLAACTLSLARAPPPRLHLPRRRPFSSSELD